MSQDKFIHIGLSNTIYFEYNIKTYRETLTFKA